MTEPIYRLYHSVGGCYDVNVWLGGTAPGFDPDDSWSPAHTVDVARTTTREAAIAVMRLHGVTHYHDWTQPRAHWGMPLTPLNESDADP